MNQLPEMDYSDADFRRLDDFPLKWRWTDPRWNKLPPDDLAAIRIFSEIAANRLHNYCRVFLDQAGLAAAMFSRLVRLDTSLTERPATEQWLLNHCSPAQKIIVSWDERLAATTDLNVFCRYWNDFCYPASDDVTIFPLDWQWMLFHSHDECFMFGELSSSKFTISLP